MCRDLGAVALIDDSLRYALECASSLRVVYLFGEYGWNRTPAGTHVPDNVVRVASWADLVPLAIQLSADIAREKE